MTRSIRLMVAVLLALSFTFYAPKKAESTVGAALLCTGPHFAPCLALLAVTSVVILHYSANRQNKTLAITFGSQADKEKFTTQMNSVVPNDEVKPIDYSIPEACNTRRAKSYLCSKVPKRIITAYEQDDVCGKADRGTILPIRKGFFSKTCMGVKGCQNIRKMMKRAAFCARGRQISGELCHSGLDHPHKARIERARKFYSECLNLALGSECYDGIEEEGESGFDRLYDEASGYFCQ